MRVHRALLALSAVLWSGPQFPFLSRYFHPEDAHRDNPRTGSASDALIIILILLALVVAVALLAAMLFTALMPRFS